MGTEKIEEYLELTGLTKKDLAIKCRISVNWFCLIMKGKEKISPFIAEKISKYTKDKIKYEDLTDEPHPKAIKRIKN